jgi:multidrug efflux pump subunit AcrB
VSSPEQTEEEFGERSGFLAYMAHNSVAANLLMLVLIVGGLVTLPRLKQEVFPEFELDIIVIGTAYPGASPEEVEQGVILAIEEAVRAVDGIKEVRSTAQEGMGNVTCELLLGTDPDRALADIKSAVDRITSFPLDVEEPVVSRPAIRSETISVIVYGDGSETNLRTIAEEVREDLLQDPGITTIELNGVRPLEIAIEVPQENLRRFGLTHGEVAEAVRRASVEVPAGAVKTRGGEVLLRTTERRDRGAEFEDIVVRSRPDGTQVTIGDLATVRDGYSEVDRAATYDGQRAIMVRVFRVGNQTPLDIAAAVHAYVAEHEADLPPGLHFATWNDRSEMYEDRVDLLRRNATMGLILVLVCLGLFLELRLAFWVTLGIPISFVGALIPLSFTSASINMISLFAFILTLGMVVDDAIVVGEAIYKNRTDGDPPMTAAVRGVRSVAVPVIFAIMTSCIAFSPLLTVPGVSGKFFMQIPIVVILVLLLSLVESLLVLPSHLGHEADRIHWPWWFLTGGIGLVVELMARFRPLVATQQRFSRLVEWLIEKTYTPTLKVALRFRYVTLSLCIAVLIGTAGLVAGGRVEFTFFPKIDGDIVSARAELPFGVDVRDTQAVHDALYAASQRVLARFDVDESVVEGRFSLVGANGAAVGGGPANRGGNDGSHLTDVAVSLVSSDERPMTARQFAEAWREEVGQLPGLESLTFIYSTGAGGDASIDFQLSHPDLEVLEEAAARLAEGLGGFAGVIDIDDGFSEGKAQLDFTLTPEARSRGLTETALARQVRDAFFGSEAVRQQRGRDELRVYIRRPRSERERPRRPRDAPAADARRGRDPALRGGGGAALSQLHADPPPRRAAAGERHGRHGRRHQRQPRGGPGAGRARAGAAGAVPAAPRRARRLAGAAGGDPRSPRHRLHLRPHRHVRADGGGVPELLPARDHRHGDPLRHRRRRPRAHRDALRPEPDEHDGRRRPQRGRGQRQPHPRRRDQQLPQGGVERLRSRHARGHPALPTHPPDQPHHLPRADPDDPRDERRGALPHPDGPSASASGCSSETAALAGPTVRPMRWT